MALKLSSLKKNQVDFHRFLLFRGKSSLLFLHLIKLEEVCSVSKPFLVDMFV